MFGRKFGIKPQSQKHVRKLCIPVVVVERIDPFQVVFSILSGVCGRIGNPAGLNAYHVSDPRSPSDCGSVIALIALVGDIAIITTAASVLAACGVGVFVLVATLIWVQVQHAAALVGAQDS